MHHAEDEAEGEKAKAKAKAVCRAEKHGLCAWDDSPRRARLFARVRACQRGKRLSQCPDQCDSAALCGQCRTDRHAVFGDSHRGACLLRFAPRTQPDRQFLFALEQHLAVLRAQCAEGARLCRADADGKGAPRGPCRLRGPRGVQRLFQGAGRLCRLYFQCVPHLCPVQLPRGRPRRVGGSACRHRPVAVVVYGVADCRLAVVHARGPHHLRGKHGEKAASPCAGICGAHLLSRRLCQGDAHRRLCRTDEDPVSGGGGCAGFHHPALCAAHICADDDCRPFAGGVSADGRDGVCRLAGARHGQDSLR